MSRALYLKTVRIAAANINKAKPGEPIRVCELEQGERLLKVGEQRIDLDGNMIVQLFIER